MDKSRLSIYAITGLVFFILLPIGSMGAYFLMNTSSKDNCTRDLQVTRGELVTILDVHKEEDCENQTLLEANDRLRMIRCGYFGKVGDQFYFVDS